MTSVFIKRKFGHRYRGKMMWRHRENGYVTKDKGIEVIQVKECQEFLTNNRI